METQSETVGDSNPISPNDHAVSQIDITDKGKPRTYSDVWNHMKREVHDNGNTAICNYSAGPDLFDYLSKKRKISNKSELDTYFEEDNMGAQDELDILKFWKDRSAGSPCLAAVARDILMVPISSVPSESVFSLGKKMITPCRSSLASTTIEALACYEDWLRVKGFESGPSKILKIGIEASSDAEDKDGSVITTE